MNVTRQSVESSSGPILRHYLNMQEYRQNEIENRQSSVQSYAQEEIVDVEAVHAGRHESHRQAAEQVLGRPQTDGGAFSAPSAAAAPAAAGNAATASQPQATQYVYPAAAGYYNPGYYPYYGGWPVTTAVWPLAGHVES